MKPLAMVGSLCTTLALTLAAFQPAHGSGPETGIQSIEEPVSGQDAVERLGSDLPELADEHDLSARELRDLLRHDDGTYIAANGRLVAQHPVAPATHLSSAANWDWNVPDGSAFALESKPGSTKTIYLDFNGWSRIGPNAWTDTEWVNKQRMKPAVAGFNFEGSSSSYTASELRSIKWIWSQVAEDYAPFDVNVTTKEPSNLRATIERANAADAQFGTHVVITSEVGLSSRVCLSACSGVAFVGVFSHYSGKKYGKAVDKNLGYAYQPAWVFTEWTGGSASYIADTASHEAGHTLGLLHSTATNNPNGYYAGHNNWSPIMGTSNHGVHRPLSQWSKGDFSSAFTKQDQVATIRNNGLAFRADEAGHDIPSAKRLRSGVISTPADLDTIVIGQCSVATSITVETATMANLGVHAELLNADGSRAAIVTGDATGSTATGQSGIGFPSSDQKPSNTNATLTVPAGAPYYLRLRGAGSSTNGYSTYGSLGQWRLSSPCDAGSGSPAGAPVGMQVSRLDRGVLVTWQRPTTGRIQDITGWRVMDVDNNVIAELPETVRAQRIAGLVNGTAYTYRVVPLIGTAKTPGPEFSQATGVPSSIPSAPKLTKAMSGKKGGKVTAHVRWNTSSANNGSAVTHYRVTAYRYKGKKVVKTTTSPWIPVRTRAYEMSLPKKGKYTFKVASKNAAGWSKLSNGSKKVDGR